MGDRRRGEGDNGRQLGEVRETMGDRKRGEGEREVREKER